jgi:hypothetical protein
VSTIKTVRYVTWPRDQVRTIEADKEWAPTQFGIMYHITKQSKILIPWANVIEITEYTPPEPVALVKPKPRKLILPK